MIDQDFPLKENIFFKEGEGTICEKVTSFGKTVFIID
jgi:hypothetical protein